MIIVGGGMAAFGLCDRLSRRGSIVDFDVTIFGEEPQLAYDRVNLSKFFSGRSAEELSLATSDWYTQHRIDFRTGCRIERINPTQQLIFDEHEHAHAYDQLVLATGSHAFVPPIAGSRSPGVFVYRTLSDLTSIAAYCERVGAKAGTVMGGGLLGLEAAKVLVDLGLKVSVIEMAPGLMPRQLDSEAAKRLKSHVESLGVAVHLVRRTESIEPIEDGRLSIQFANADPLEVDVMIIAAGVRPNDSIARSAGLAVGPRGGIVVDETLRTSDPKIYAIGECTSYRDHVYGLVAPCYRMADVLAARLSGEELRFQGADESAELKLMGVDVATLGRTIGESTDGIVLKYEDESGYRKLLIERGRIVGASCIGPWEDLPMIRHAIHERSRLWPWQRKRFLQTGSPWTSEGALPVAQWPADSVICSCLSVNKSTIVSLIDQGICDIPTISQRCGAASACGSCRPLVSELAGAPSSDTRVPGATTMLVASLIAVAMGWVWMLMPSLELASSVQSSWRSVDVLWRDDLARQITGFSLLGLTLVGLIFSLRKRMAWFQWGSYGTWRAIHGILGTAVLIGLAVHTGLKLGSNLNFVLGVCFIAAGVLGGVAGIASSCESRTTGQAAMWLRKWRPRLTQIHLWVTWPLPALVVLHVISFYWFGD
nr:FAD-dependent oxidoreductase [Neorhodopirellula pilleata]